jgi:hypothetical protein
MITLVIAVLMLPGVIIAAFVYIWVSSEDQARKERHRR